MRDAVLAGLQTALPLGSLLELQRQGADWDEDEGFARAGLGPGN
jgi:hypothetical protein